MAGFGARKVVAFKIGGILHPVAADYIRRGRQQAHIGPAECLLIQLHRPERLLNSPRIIIRDILVSPVPVVVLGAPGRCPPEVPASFEKFKFKGIF
jgi:membrane-bound ClpP family serine protease